MRTRERDPLELTIELGLCPGTFIGWREEHQFHEGLERVRLQVEEVAHNEPERAIRLCETFLAGCLHKIEEVDDSAGSLSALSHGLVATWVQSCQAARRDPNSTIVRILSWQARDRWGLLRMINHAVLPSLNRTWLRAYRDIVSELHAEEQQGPHEQPSSCEQRDTVQLLKDIYAALSDIRGYINLCQVTTLDSQDCLVVAQIHDRRRRPEDALEWVERGLELGGERGLSNTDLRDMQRRLFLRLGRREEAVKLAWDEMEKRPSAHTLKDLLATVSKAERQEWQRRALDFVRKGPLDPFLEVAFELRALEALAERLGRTCHRVLTSLSHFVTEPIAEALRKDHPAVAARLYRALALRIVDAGKSRYYHAALDNLASARECYEEAGQGRTWRALVRQIEKDHHRKYAFMPGFKEVVSGRWTQRQTFLDEAREAWAERFENRMAADA